MKIHRVPITLLSAILLVAAAPAKADTDLFQLSLEELMAMQVTSVSKSGEPLSEAAAAVFVIRREDIRRSGLTSIPELLRMVPGLHVGQIDSSKWAISSRGFNGRWSNKLLVLLDGRSVYTPLFSGVYWDIQDTLLEDIDRIEVIRGPGGTLWGANAVNGVINIITRHSRDSQGSLAAVQAGDRENGVNLRYGSTLGDTGWFRVYAKATDHDNFVDAIGDAAHDAWNQQRAGFRADWEPTGQDALTLQGDLYQGDADQETGYLADLLSMATFVEDTVDQNGGNLLFRWQHSTKQGSEIHFQTYFDHNERNDITLGQSFDTFDMEFQHRFQASERQEVTWGTNYRRVSGQVSNSFTVSFDPSDQTKEDYGIFFQDQIRLRDDLRLTAGSKFEHNDYTGFEFQPNVRLLWLASEKHTFWGAASRAVRTPGWTDRDIRINVATFSSPFVDPDGPGPLPAGAPTLISILGSEDIRSEKVLAFELGYRGQPNRGLSLEAAAFYNQYDDLVTSETSFGLETMPAPPHALISSNFDNQMQGVSYGLELGANWQATPDWRLYAGYTWQQVNVKLDSGSSDVNNVGDREESNPEQQFQLRSRWDIRDNLELDTTLFHVGGISPSSNTGRTRVPGYERLDMRLAWRPKKNLELSLVGQNLLEDQHVEFLSRDILPTEVPRAMYGRIKYEFN